MLPPPTDGFITFTEGSASGSTEFETTATYGCEEGFGVVSGNVTRICQESSTPGVGEWSGIAAVCEGM